MSASDRWPADKVERWPTDRLVPYVRNARTHSDAQIAQIAGSIREWGWTMPVLADEAGGLIAGHCRVLAARKLGLTEIPVMVANGWTEAQKRAYVIADNKLTLNAGWDADILRVELTDLKDMGADLSLVGFSEEELADLLNSNDEGGVGSRDSSAGSLADRFGIPPFSVLNAREGWWQDRKRAWIGLGIQSELGRGNDNLSMSHPATTATIDFYAQKRDLESKVGRELTTNEAKEMMASSGTLLDARAANAARKSDMTRSGAVMPVSGGDVKAQLLSKRGYAKP